MEMNQVDSVIYEGVSKYDDVPSEIYIETENEGYGSSERIPVEIIPIPSQAFSFAGKIMYHYRFQPNSILLELENSNNIK